MNGNLKRFAAIATAALAVAACEMTQSRTGGVAGNVFFGRVGPTMDESDKQRAIASVRSGKNDTWRGANGNNYTFTNTRTFDSGSLQCRDYTIVATVGGQPVSTQGTACRGSDGSWSSGG